jgi:hypothetical protein
VVVLVLAAFVLAGATLATRDATTRDAPVVAWVPIESLTGAPGWPWVGLEAGTVRTTPGGAREPGRWMSAPATETAEGDARAWRLHRWIAPPTLVESLRDFVTGRRTRRVPECLSYAATGITRADLFGVVWHAVLREEGLLAGGEAPSDLVGLWKLEPVPGTRVVLDMDAGGIARGGRAPPPVSAGAWWSIHGDLLVFDVRVQRLPGHRVPLRLYGAAEHGAHATNIEGHLVEPRGGGVLRLERAPR